MPVALETGQQFAIREGGLTVGAGPITEIIGVGIGMVRVLFQR